MLWIILGTLISYLIGSIPFAYIFGKVLKGIDIRNFGSGNIGATNAVRVLGKGPGIAVLVLDILKGFVAVVILGNLVVLKNTNVVDDTLRIILGLSCISGHNWTIFLNFKGGKGVATTFGVLLGLSIKIAGLKLILSLMVLTWFLIFIIIRIVSVASVLTATTFPVYIIIFSRSCGLKFLSVLLCVFVLIRHKSNLKRIFQGKEPHFTFRKSV